MSRPLRINYPGAFYHITSRGNARRDVFLNTDERELFYEVLFEVTRDYNWICHADCQMTNHVHLGVETPDANLSEGMRQLNGVFTRRLNRSRGTVGHIFQGRFKSRLVDSESYLLAVCRYIVLNPVRAKMVNDPRACPWSSYRATVGLVPPRPHLTTDGVLSQFGDRLGEARKEYVQFVLAGIGVDSPFRGVRDSILGDEHFVRGVMRRLDSAALVGEVPRRDRLAGRPSLSALSAASAPGREGRDHAMLQAWKDHGYSLKEVADEFGLHYTTVSKLIAKSRVK